MVMSSGKVKMFSKNIEFKDGVLLLYVPSSPELRVHNLSPLLDVTWNFNDEIRMQFTVRSFWFSDTLFTITNSNKIDKTKRMTNMNSQVVEKTQANTKEHLSYTNDYSQFHLEGVEECNLVLGRLPDLWTEKSKASKYHTSFSFNTYYWLPKSSWQRWDFKTFSNRKLTTQRLNF